MTLARKWSLIAALALGFVGLPFARAEQPAHETQVASAEQLKVEAFKALCGGQFDRTHTLITRAAEVSKDPSTVQLAAWVSQFESQRQTFAAERQKQFDKSVADVKKLIDGGKKSYAIDAAAAAYSLATDKNAFVSEPWVKDLIQYSITSAEQADKDEQWLRSLRLYSDLTQIEPSKPEWKDRLKLATRRVRLLALYTPDDLKALQESESKDRLEAAQLLNPTTQPTTKPAEAADADSFRIDWKDTLKGVQLSMLRTAMIEARNQYWREVDYKTLMTGGLKGLQAVATTRGLEDAFAGLKDESKRGEFLAAINAALDQCREAGAATDQKLLAQTLDAVVRANRSTIELPEEVLVSEFADGAFAELDPFTSMIWPYDIEEFNKSTQGEFTGVGIQIQLDDDGSLKVVSPLEDTPAYRQGIKAGDIITRIDGKSTKGITTNQAVKTITGPEGKDVTLTIRDPKGVEKDFTITREKIRVASLKGWSHLPGGGWDYFVDPQQKIAYMRLTNFTKDTGSELDKAVEQMVREGAKAMILDLRYNPGGLLTAATDVADKFLKDGVIVSTKTDPSRDSPVQPPLEAHATADDVAAEIPLVVLVNQYSASASEIVSGALKDWRRALIVGERTFGKGSVQMLFPLRDKSAYLKLTTSHYYLPGGKCIHRDENSVTWGVDPDVSIEMTPDQMRAVIDARQEQDVLRYETDNKEEVAAAGAPTTQPAKKDLLQADPQLAAAVLLLRMQLAGVNG